MSDRITGRRAVLAGGAALAAGLRRARAAPAPIRLLTNWYAQAEHGGFYQAEATGLYRRAGIDATIGMGGPQMNIIQLMLAGRCDLVLAQPEQVLTGLARGLPLVAVATSFQKSLGGLLTHPDITDLAQLKGHPILLSAEGKSGFWSWLQKRYGYSDSQLGRYTFNLQPFLFNPALAMQSFATAEPYAASKQGIPNRFFLLADQGYDSYGNMLVTTREVLRERRETLAGFLGATGQGWHDFLNRDPAPARAAILRANAAMTADQIDWSIGALKRLRALGAPGSPIGHMDPARWSRIRDIIVGSGLIPASLAWRDGYSLDFAGAMTAAA